MGQKLRKNLRILLPCILCLAVLTAGVLYVKAAGRNTDKSINITIGRKNVTKSTYRMKAGKTKNCKVTVRPADAGDKISYQSSDRAVVSVNSRGKISAKRAGSARITVTVKRGGRKKSTWTKIKVTDSSPDVPSVYMTQNIDSASLIKIYQALQWTPSGRVAVKLSTGEPPASNYLDPDLIRELVQSVDGTIVECNTAYGGLRSSTAMHMQVAKDHGFTEIADVDIQDEEGSLEIPVKGGARLSENYVTHSHQSAARAYNAWLCFVSGR